MRTIIIGDVHGCRDALMELLRHIRPVPGQDRLVFLGDLFDRGPDSYGVWQTVKELSADFSNDLILLLGNHEDYLIQDHLTVRQRMIWENVGRQATVLSFRRADADMEDAAAWLRDRLMLFWVTERFQCVHAGLMIDPPEVNDRQTLVHDHEIVLQNRYAGPLTITGHIALENAMWFTGDGETVQELDEGISRTLPEHGVICIDTGCGKGGRLTAMIVEENDYTLISVPEK